MLTINNKVVDFIILKYTKQYNTIFNTSKNIKTIKRAHPGIYQKLYSSYLKILLPIFYGIGLPSHYLRSGK